jgi:NAD(P)-dependent dehydrogenase (short-subunit alcohol dehydrogenase family)
MSVLDLFRLDAKNAIVTGSAQGLGKAMAQALGEAGANVAIVDINIDLARKTAEEFSKKVGKKFIAIQADVTREEDVRRMVEEVVANFSHIDILVNNAGIVRHAPAEVMSKKDWDDVIAVNFTGVFLCSQAVGRHMIGRKQGKIINIASMSGLIVNYPQPQVAYNASKAGVIMLTKSLAVEWAKYNINVNAIAPGYMKTAMTAPFFEKEEYRRLWLEPTPMKRPGEPEELTGAVVYLASDASSFMTGQVLVIDGGYTLL